jgi:ParB-like chromosome segregation protein Spo0J
MNVNLDKSFLKTFKHGRLVDSLFAIDIHWVTPDSLHIPYTLDKDEVKRSKEAIKGNRRQNPVIVLQDIGIVAGIHNLKAYQDLKFDRIPILYGKIK